MKFLFVFLVFCATTFSSSYTNASEDMDSIDFADAQTEFEEDFSADIEDVFLPEEDISSNHSDNIDIPPPPSSNFSISTVSNNVINNDEVFSAETDDSQSPVAVAPSPEDTLSVDTTATLTENLKQGAPEAPKSPLPNVGDTWIGKLVATQTDNISDKGEKSSGNEELNKLLDSARSEAPKKKLSNASVFDISGVMLRMSLEQADKALTNRRYKKVVAKDQIPNFIKWRNEELCRKSGVVGYERLENCITKQAKKDNHQYVQTVKYAKYDTKEEIELTLTSNFTANKVIKIEYRSQAANKTGNSPKSVYLRNIKIYDFWKTVNQKYGQPDDKDKAIWGMGGNKPYLKAATGYLKLEDPMLRELDYTRMSREDQRYMNTDLYTF
ncbi:MAG: hypothetical protein IJV97_05730 [Alphaproteobacteria bacterium]|nr:hypothetical protein [Alphaproteobacteria bacterium]